MPQEINQNQKKNIKNKNKQIIQNSEENYLIIDQEQEDEEEIIWKIKYLIKINQSNI